MQCYDVFGSIRIGVFMIQFHGFEYPPNMKDNNPFHAKRHGITAVSSLPCPPLLLQFFLFTWPLNSNMNHREHQSWTRNLLITWSAPNFLLRTGNNFVKPSETHSKIQRIGAITILMNMFLFVSLYWGGSWSYFRQPHIFVQMPWENWQTLRILPPFPPEWYFFGIQSHPKRISQEDVLDSLTK